VFLARISGAAAHSGTAAEPRLLDDGEDVTVNAETFHRQSPVFASTNIVKYSA